jgi:hypothetical protein
MGVNMLGYAEIQTDQYASSRLMNTFLTTLHLNNRRFHDSDFETFFGTDESTPFLGAVLKDKSHVYLALNEFLKKERQF